MNYFFAILFFLGCTSPKKTEKTIETPTKTPEPTKTPVATPMPIRKLIFIPEKPERGHLFYVTMCGFEPYELISLYDNEKRFGKMVFDKHIRCHQMVFFFKQTETIKFNTESIRFNARRGTEVIDSRDLTL